MNASTVVILSILLLTSFSPRTQSAALSPPKTGGVTEDYSQRGKAAPPAAFTYDPISGRSRANTSALDARMGTSVATGLAPGSSFTIEAFAKPVDDLSSKPRDVLPVLTFHGTEALLMTGVVRSRQIHGYQWWTTRLQQGKERPIDLARGRYNGIAMVRGETPWRHLAVTWDATTRTLASFLDYRLQTSVRLTNAPGWDLSRLAIGRHKAFKKEFRGWIDEVRVTPAALEPWHFLRAIATPLTNVSFAPETRPALPADYGHIDVRLHYGAVGDGVHDDTAAIRRAFEENNNRVPIEYMTVYFPAGTYLISDSIRFSRFMVVRGAGADRTVIRLKDHAPGYQDIAVPKPAFAVGYDWPYVGRSNRQRAGNVIGNFVFDLGVNTGSGNPAALGLDFHCNNIGGVENVNIRSADGAGLVGLDLKRGWPGPCLIKNVSITGFDHGIDAAHREYSLVFSDIRLEQQRVAAIRNRGNILSLEKVVSRNSVPALENSGGGLVVLMRSQLHGGATDATAIRSDNASLYLRDVQIAGYGTGVSETRTPKGQPTETLTNLPAGRVDEHFTGPFDNAFEPAARGSLKLPIKDTPLIPRPPVSAWVNVLHYQDRVKDGDWAPAIQAAVDAGKPLVYFPPDVKYEIKSDVILRGTIRTFFGGSPKTGIGNGTGKDVDPGSGPALVLGADLPRFQFDLLDVAHVRHATPTDLVFRHCGFGHITTQAGCGDLFIEDTGGKFRFSRHQRVWGRQLNPETKGVPEIINDGAQFWILGLKTEYLSTKIENRNGARTEVLGGLMYPVHPVTDETLPMFVNENSDISLVHGVSVYKKNHKIYMRDTRGDETREFRDWRWINGRPIANLYRSSR